MQEGQGHPARGDDGGRNERGSPTENRERRLGRRGAGVRLANPGGAGDGGGCGGENEKNAEEAEPGAGEGAEIGAEDGRGGGADGVERPAEHDAHGGGVEERAAVHAPGNAEETEGAQLEKIFRCDALGARGGGELGFHVQDRRHIELRGDEQEIGGEAVRRNQRCGGHGDRGGGGEIVGEAHDKRGAHRMAEKDGAAGSDLAAPFEGGEQAAGAGFVGGEGEWSGVRAVAGRVHQIYAEAGGGELLAIGEHDDAIRAEAVENDGGAARGTGGVEDQDWRGGAGGAAVESDIAHGAVAAFDPEGAPGEQDDAESGEDEF